jgi:Acetyl-coenzyme A synthetase N-terminus
MGTGALREAFNRSLKDPAGFWGEAADSVHWYKKWDRVLDDSRPPFYRLRTSPEVTVVNRRLHSEPHGSGWLHFRLESTPL